MNLYDHVYWTHWGSQESIPEFARAVAKAVKEVYSIPGYTEDVLGQNHRHEESFVTHTEEVIRRFMELPDDICKGCAIGAHCRTYGDGSLLAEDRKWIGWIVPFSQQMSIDTNSTIKVTKEVATFLDAEPVEVRRVRTTVGMIHHALPYFLY